MMTDDLHLGFDQLPGVDLGSLQPQQAAPDRPNSTDADLSFIPEARTTSKGPEAWPEPTHPLRDLLWKHTGPQEAPKPDDTDITGSMAGAPIKPEAPPPTAAPAPGSTAPDAAGLPTQAPPAPQRPLSADEQMQEWLHPTTDEGKQWAAAIDNVIASARAMWESDNFISKLQNATSDAIGNIVEGAKAKLGVTLEDPTHGGYHDEAEQRVLAQAQFAAQANSWRWDYFDPINPEGFFGGGYGFKDAVQKAQMDIFDEKRQALAEKIKGDQAYDRAGENSDALALLDADTPATMLGAKLSHQANVAASEASAAVSNPVVRVVGEIAGGLAGGTRDPVNDALLMTGAGLDPVLAKTYFPLASKAIRVVSDATEVGVRQALMNMGLTAIAAPSHQAANEQRGEDHGLVPFLHDMEDAGLGGFIPGALIHGVKALGLLHGADARPWIDEFIREVKRQSAAEQHETFLKEAAATPHDPTQAEAAPEFPSETATDPAAREEIITKSRTFMDAVHAHERMMGLPEGSTYSDVGRNRPGEPLRPAAGEQPGVVGLGVPEYSTKYDEGLGYHVALDKNGRELSEPEIGSIISRLNALIGRGTDSITRRNVKAGIVRLENASARFNDPDAGRNRPPPGGGAAPPPPPGGGAEQPQEPPRGGGPAGGGGGAEATEAASDVPRLEGPRRLLTGPGFPKSPDLSDAARNRPSPSSITPAAIDKAEADYRALPPRMPGVPPSEHLRTFIEALRHGEAPDVFPPPEPPMSAPPARDANFLPPDHLPELATAPGEPRAGEPGLNHVPHMAAGTVFEHEGKPVTKGIEFRARDLRTDAATYQYKAGGDAKGVTDRLSTVKKWSPVSAGNLVVHERLDGHRYVADGHQRTGLANRIMDADPSQDISIPGFLYKEKDGWTPEAVRAEAALKNIREGIGDTIDIARVLRDAPERWDDSLPIGRHDMKEARGLANLSDESWHMMLNGKPRRDYASFVGNMAEDKSTHLAIMDDLVKYNPKTQNEARMIIADAMQAGFNKSEQVDLFGPSEVTTSLRGERSKVYAAAEKLLQDDKKIFGMLNAEAPRIIEAGNILADTNAERADRAGQLAQGLITLAERAGPISSALNRAAQRVADGEHPKTAARTFLNELPALLNQEGLRVADISAVPKYDLDQPKGREEQTRDLEAEFMATQPTMFAEPPKTFAEQRDAIANDVKQKYLDIGVPEVQAEQEGAIWAARYATRAARMGRSDPEQMYREANMVARGDAQREAEMAGEAAPEGRTLNQPATVPTFYSAVERAVTNAKQAKASPDQWLAMLKNMPGVKPEEMKFLGLEDWLRDQKGPVTRAEVAEFVRANSIQIHEVTHRDEEGAPAGFEAENARDWLDRHGGDPARAERAYLESAGRSGIEPDAETIAAIRRPPATPTKFRQYSLPGGQNYRELLLTLPEKDKITTREVKVPAGWGDVNGGDVGIEREGDTGADYRSGHWREPNVVAHVRYDDRMVDGKRALHLAEIQSDWAQSKRKGNKVPEAPYIGSTDSWTTLSLKRMIRHAAENGYDLLTWDTGATNAERYDLSKQISKVEYEPKIGTIEAFDHKGESAFRRKATPDELPDIIGKEAADRLLSTEPKPHVSYILKKPGTYETRGPYEGFKSEREAREWLQGRSHLIGEGFEPWEVTSGGLKYHTLEGLDLKVGGEGMMGFYDRIIPAAVSKLTKKFGGKVTISHTETAKEERVFVLPDEKANAEHGEDLRKLDEDISAALAQELEAMISGESGIAHGNAAAEVQRLREARDALFRRMVEESNARAAPRQIPVHALAITPALRDAAVNEGFPLFQPAARAGEEPRASITIRDNGAVIDMFKKANKSSLQHEAAHLWLKELGEDAAHPDAPAQIKNDFQEVLDWLGAKDAASITDEQHEKWARGWEQYLRSGKAPSSALARAFEMFSQWLKAIYRTLRGLGKEIPDNIRAVMDRMLATDDEIEARRAETTRTEATESPRAPTESPAAVNEPPAEPAPAAAAPTAAPAIATGDPLVDRVTADSYVSSAITDPVINRENDVPYGAGPNKANDRVVNIDRHVPKTDTIKGVKYDPARAVAVHEQVEKHALDQLTAAGVPEAQAYEVAHFVFAEPAERAWVEQNVGPNAWSLYQKHWDKWLAPIDHENPANPPPDLYQKPYPHDDDHLAPEDRGSDKKFEETGHHNLPELRAIAERVFGEKALGEAVEGGKIGDTEATVRGVAHEIAVAAKASPDPLDQKIGQILEREIAPLIDEAFPAAAEPEPAAEPAPPPPPPQSALNHAEDMAGRVAYHNGDIALIQGFSRMTGAPVYVGAKGDLRANLDIETDKTKLFTPEERAELVAAKRAAVAADAAAHAANPDGPFAGGARFAASPSVPENLASFTKGLIDLVGIKERVYLTTVEDAKATQFSGPFAAIGSAGLDTGAFGTTRRLPNGDHCIAIKVGDNEQLNLETVSHEVGHIVEKTSWLNAPPEVKAAVDAEYEKWRDEQRAPGVKARDLIRSTRTRETAKSITLPDETLLASGMNRRDSYWTAKDEWFADQVARWATSSKKPMTLVEKFFASIAALLRRIHDALSGYKPVKSMKDWLDSLSPTDIEQDEAASRAEPPSAAEPDLVAQAFPGASPAERADMRNLPPDYLRAVIAHNEAQAVYNPIRDAFRKGKVSEKDFLAARKVYDAATKEFDKADAARNAAPAAAEPGPEGSQQTLMPGVSPVRDADRIRLAANAPLRGGNREMPAGGLFDDGARAQMDLMDWRDMVADMNGNLVPPDKVKGQNFEASLAKLVDDCQL